jgi:glycosyltransferase involved in cell wall biosynthesis
VTPTESKAESFEPLVWIVCSVHRPGRFLDAQIESLRDQTHQNWKLLVGVDGRDDDAQARLDAFAVRDARIFVAPAGGEPLGAAASFGRLLEAALERGAQWLALADQDDIWHPDKLSRGLTRVAELTKNDPPDGPVPLLLHSDLEVVDADGVRVHASLFAYQHIGHEPVDPLRVLVVQNFVTGCATLMNRALLDVALPIPPDAVMHDWWLALCAAAVGRIELIEPATLSYRQHADNQIGAQRYGETVRSLAARTVRLRRHAAEPLLRTLRQVDALRDRLNDDATVITRPASQADPRAFVQRYLSLFAPGVSRWRRVWGLHALGVGRQDGLLDLSLKAKLLTTPIHLEASQSSP